MWQWMTTMVALGQQTWYSAWGMACQLFEVPLALSMPGQGHAPLTRPPPFPPWCLLWQAGAGGVLPAAAAA